MAVDDQVHEAVCDDLRVTLEQVAHLRVRIEELEELGQKAAVEIMKHGETGDVAHLSEALKLLAAAIPDGGEDGE